jgi:hypothetical protein
MSYSERKKEKKNLRCVVCNERAVGYNFDQISCESCKGKIDKISKIIFFQILFHSFFSAKCFTGYRKYNFFLLSIFFHYIILLF